MIPVKESAERLDSGIYARLSGTDSADDISAIVTLKKCVDGSRHTEQVKSFLYTWLADQLEIAN
jgi:hypothetical protein